jgi:glycosyltransferase involved in cell wall biosynthesis
VRPVPSVPVVPLAVSVVVTAYNYGRFLPECAASVLSQRHVDVRLIIVDDGSGDDTPEVCDRLAADERVQVIRHARNQGHIAAVNHGLEAVDTPYVVKLDADDLLAPGALARAAALFESHPEVGLVYGRPRHFAGPPPPGAAVGSGAASVAETRSWTLWRGHDWLERRCRSSANVISSPEVMARTDVVRAAGPRPAALPHTYDLELWLQIAARADVGRVNGPAQGYYRVHGDSQQRTVHAGVLFDLQGRLDAFTAALASVADEVPHHELLLATVRRRLAAAALDRACRAYDRGKLDEVPVDELVAFAVTAWPSAASLPQWRALERRRALHRRHDALLKPFVVRALARRASEEVSRWRWERTGEL